MQLEYKPDWEETKERYRAWWAGEYIGRCALAVTAPKSNVLHGDPPAPPDGVQEKWLDFRYQSAFAHYVMRRTFYGGEALPVWNAGYPGWANHGPYLGTTVVFGEDTAWVDFTIHDGDLTDHDYRDLKLDPGNHWWKLTLEMLRVGAEDSLGKCIPSIGAIGGCGDTLASLRGTDKLLTDLIDCPDYVREFELYLMRQWMEIYDACYAIVERAAEGSTCWFTLWSPGKFYAAQNDFSYMISPRMFEEIFIPVIEMQTELLDHSIYHVDGVGAFNHVDVLCCLPRLQALQILPGSGKPSPLYYMDVLKKVQKAGKNLHIGLPADQIEEALSQLSARGLFIETRVGSEEEARALLKKVEHWSKDRG